MNFKDAFWAQLIIWNACSSGLMWYDKQPISSIAELWEVADRPDWMLWLASKCKVDADLIKLSAVECAALCYVKEYIFQGLLALTKQFLQGRCTSTVLEEVLSEAKIHINHSDTTYAAWTVIWAARAALNKGANADWAALNAWKATRAQIDGTKKLCDAIRKCIPIIQWNKGDQDAV
jgi:hypothetical protein